MSFNEYIVEDTALAWFGRLSYAFGPAICPMR